MGITLSVVSLLILLPLSLLFVNAAGLTWVQLKTAILSDRALAAFKLSFGTAAAAALINACFGLVVAWVLVRYRFFGRSVVDALVDLPFALPTAVAGVALTSLWGPNGWLGSLMPFPVAFTSIGITLALVFIGMPFVVRTVQPVIEDLDKGEEEAAASLGATPWMTFRRVTFPAIRPALVTGATLAFARGLGEYGSVIFIAGNLQGETEIAPLLIVSRLEQYDYAGATGIAATLLTASFVTLAILGLLQRRKVA